jgi:hypothetical protein
VSSDTCLAQDAVAEPPGILLGVNRHPHLLARRGVLQQQVAALTGPDLDESNGLRLPDHLGPDHLSSMNLPIGFVHARGDATASIPVCDGSADPAVVVDVVESVRC